jgi:hypothetical protein
MMHCRWWSVWLLGGVVLAGCSGSASEKMINVKGTVTLDEKPMPEGEIVFRTPGVPPYQIPIKNGAFEGKSLPGKKVVEIRAFKPAPPPPPMPGAENEPGVINYLPERYNDASKLEAEVTLSGPNEFEFKVTSK